MGEGIVDSRLTRHKFWLTVESLDESVAPKANQKYQVPSLLATHLANSLNYPANVYFVERWDETMKLDLLNRFHLFKTALPCDLHLVNLRTLTEPDLPLFPSQSALMIFQRFGYDCRLAATSVATMCGPTTIPNEIFNDVYIGTVDSVSLTGLKQLGHVQSLVDIRIEPMELKTFNVTFV